MQRTNFAFISTILYNFKFVLRGLYYVTNSGKKGIAMIYDSPGTKRKQTENFKKGKRGKKTHKC